MTIWNTVSTSVEMTEKLGEALGKVAQPGNVITLDGDLGAGKTAFTRGLARGMGLRSRVTSPTFTIVNEYNDENGVPRLFHFDTYRLSCVDDFYDAGLDEYFERDGVCAIEWSSVIEEALPEQRIAKILETLQPSAIVTEPAFETLIGNCMKEAGLAEDLAPDKLIGSIFKDAVGDKAEA